MNEDNVLYQMGSWSPLPYSALLGLVALALFALFFAALKLWHLRRTTNSDMRVFLRFLSYVLTFLGLGLWLAKVSVDREPPLSLHNMLILGGMILASVSVLWEPVRPLTRWFPKHWRGGG